MRPLKSFFVPFVASFLLLSLVYAPAVESRRLPRVVPCAIIPTSDGTRLGGHVFGYGQEAVILAHMYPDDQTQWYGFARFLEQRGYQVLTFDFRGFGESEGQMDVARNYQDVQAAVSYLRNRGAENIYLVGASMGGTASLRAVTGRRIPGVRAVVVVSSPVQILGLSVKETMNQVRVPALFLAAEEDGEAPNNARWFYDNTGGLRELKLWPGLDHGTDLVQGSYGWEVQEAILQFLIRNRPVTYIPVRSSAELDSESGFTTPDLPDFHFVPLAPNE